MSPTLKRMAALIGGLALLSFGIVVINQTAGVVDLASEVHPTLGKVTLFGLLGTYVVLLGAPVVLFVRLPKSLDPPRSEEEPEFENHLQMLRKRLAANPLVTESDLNDRAAIERGIAQIDTKADEIIRNTASVIFLSTAVSQNGQLDMMVVLVAQSRMIWQLAHLYSQRPTLKDMIGLYANVAGTAFAAGAIQEVDLNEQIQPVLGSALGSMAGAIPGFQVAAAVLVNSVMSGTANTYLTLRVGLIAKQYCGAVVIKPKPALRRAASAQAAKMLGEIVASGTSKISNAIWEAVRAKGAQTAETISKTAMDAVSSVATSARGAGESLFRRFQRGQQPGPEGTI